MKRKDFIQFVIDDLEGFDMNMKNLKEDDNSLQDWMGMFLRWCEWQTDMHKEYWVDIEEI